MTETTQTGSPVATSPISTDAPTGQWVRYEPEFEELKQELDKIAALRANEIDWNKVVTLSTEILETKSKDLLVAGWYCLGLFNKQGYRGLADGLDAVHRLSATFWDTLFPETKRMRARISAFEWLNERVGQSVEHREAKPADREALDACVKAAQDLDAVLGDKLGGEAPSLSDLKRALKSRHDELPAQAPPPPPAAAPAPAPGAAPAAAPDGTAAAPAPMTAAPVGAAPVQVPDLGSPAADERSLNKIYAALRDLAPQLRRSRPQDPRAYRFARIGAWMPMEQLPPNTDGVTRMQPMGASGALFEQYDALAARNEWTSLLEQAESQFEKSVLWLDAQRYVAMALEELGYSDALRAVKSECAMLVGRFPGVANLKFSNETPFASDDTKTWLKQELGTASGGDSSAAPVAYVPAGEEDEEIERILAEARELAKQKKNAQATALLREAVDNGVSRKQRFRRRLALARFLSEIKEQRLAVAQLECLDEQIRRFRLEEWDPGVASQVLGLYVACQNQLLRGEWKGLPEAVRSAETVFSRLARIDAPAALGLKK